MLLLVLFTFFPVSSSTAASLALSPASVQLGKIERGTTRTGTFWLLRTSDMRGDIVFKVFPQHTGQYYFFHGNDTVVMPSDIEKIPYTFLITPDFRFQCDKNLLYISFISGADTFTAASTSIVAGIIGIVTFSTDGDAACPTDFPPPEQNVVENQQSGSSSASVPPTLSANPVPPVLPISEPVTTPFVEETKQKPVPVVSKDVVEKILSVKIHPEIFIPKNHTESGDVSRTVEEIQKMEILNESYKMMFLQKKSVPVSDLLTTITANWPDVNEEKTTKDLIVRYAYSLDTESQVDPRTLKTETTLPYGQFTVPDGIYYLHVAKRINDAIGPVQTTKIVVDQTPPAQLRVVPMLTKRHWYEDSTYQLHFDAFDATSGVDYYLIRYDEGEIKTNKNVLDWQNLTLGEHLVQVTVFDRTGNSETQSIHFLVSRRYANNFLNDMIFNIQSIMNAY